MLFYMNERLVQIDELIRVEDETDLHLYPTNYIYYSNKKTGEKEKFLFRVKENLTIFLALPSE